MIIVLMGYMGSGKSVVGQNLATVLDYHFFDLDKYISKKENMSISDIFKSKGEIFFRKTETNALNELLLLNGNLVISLGGGTPCYANNLELISNSEHTITFYLKTSIPLLTDRLYKERYLRPLISHLKTKDELSEFIGKHLFERSQFYVQSDFIIDTDNKTPNEVVEGIILKLI